MTRVVAVAALVALVLTPTATGARIVVSTTADVAAGDGACSLREAVIAARNNAAFGDCPAGDLTGTDEIVLAGETYPLSVEGRSEEAAAAGDLDIGGGAVRVSGLGPGLTVIDANGIDRAFDVPAGGSLTLEDLGVREGALGASSSESGGAVRSFGTLVLRRIELRGNAAGGGGPGTLNGTSGLPGGEGGAVWSTGTLDVADTHIAANVAGDGGDGAQGQGVPPGAGGRGGFAGGISVGAGTATIVRTAFTGNRAGAGGRGGLDLLDIPTRAAGGGGGWAGALAGGPTAVVTVENSTFAGNRAGAAGTGGAGTGAPGGGGAVLASVVAPSMTIAFSTFSGNSAAAGSTASNGVAGRARISGSILADAGKQCADGFALTVGVNVVPPGDTSCPAPRVEASPSLGPLGPNGGPTPTMVPAPGSDAVDLLPAAGCPATDQRGLPRPALARCDAGAVEVQPGTPDTAGAPGPGGGTARRTITGLTTRRAPSGPRGASRWARR